MAKKLTNKQAEDLAYSIFMTEDKITDAEIGERVGGYSRVTIGKWRRAGLWDDMKKAMTATRGSQLTTFVNQLDALNNAINARTKEEGGNYPSYNEVSIQTQLSKNIERFKGDASLVELLEHNKVVVKFIRANYPDKLKEWALMFDELVKESM